MDKFLLAENPMRPEDSGVWIIHLLDPISIIKCEEGHTGTGEIISGNIYLHFQFLNADKLMEEWTLRVHHLFTTDLMADSEKQAIKLLERAWRWYRAYMQWEDKNIELDEQGRDN